MKTTLTRIILLAALGALTALTGCSDDPAAPEERQAGEASHYFTRDHLKPEGTVVETADGYNVKGALHVETEAGETSFMNADLNVEFDEDGRVRNVTGTAEIPSPHERVQFEDPIQADVGFFSGKWLNENRDFIPLKDKTDYFVFNFKLTLQMNIATGETGEEATKPVVVKAPLGGQLLMIIDYNDPMYYVYGAQDLIGAAGTGWSLNGRIPFEPWHPVQGMGKFDGKNTRTGTFPVMKIVSVTGQMVDNEYTELHLSLADPFTSDLRMGYQVGYNGEMALDLFLKDIVGIDIPIAEGSGGMWRETSIQNIFEAYAYINGMTSDDTSWWPTFIPLKPANSLAASAFIKTSGEFDVSLAGQLGWELPSGKTAMRGSFQLNNEALTLTGAVEDQGVTLQIAGEVTKDATSVAIPPPPALLNMIEGRVTSEIDGRIAEAEQTWNDLQEATKTYEFELSLRGLRSAIPPAVDAARKALSDGIANELKKHEGEVYYSELKKQLHDADDKYYDMLDRLKAAANEIQDNDATRREIEAALRHAASLKIFEMTFTYKIKKLGVTIKTIKVDVSKRVMSDALANKLITAANNVKYIKESYDRTISLEQIYDQIPGRDIFEKVRENVENGVAIIPAFGEFGFVLNHNAPDKMNVFITVAGERRDVAEANVFSVLDMAAALTAAAVDGFIDDVTGD